MLAANGKSRYAGGMENEQLPNPDTVFPVPDNQTVIYIKPAITNRHIRAGDFSYFSGADFQSRVSHFYPGFYHDALVIGKFCQIASGVEFVMNGANHQMNCVSTFPFYIFENWGEATPPVELMPVKGDTVVGNDVWIGQNAVILPGVRIGDGAIVGAQSVVGSDVEPYSIVAGNPARLVRKRFDDELTALLLRLKWWDLPTSEIRRLVPLLHNSDLEFVKASLQSMLQDPT